MISNDAIPPRMKLQQQADRPARKELTIYLIPVLVLIVSLVVSLAQAVHNGDAVQEPGAPATKSTSAARIAPTQPSASGYRFRVLEERYVALQPDGTLQVQQRRRESWTAPDGWAWARQTGFDPARLVLPPSEDWKVIRESQPTATGVAQVLQRVVASAPDTERLKAEINYVNDLLGTETLPKSALPFKYRQAIVAAITPRRGVEVSERAVDPLGRTNVVRVSLSNSQSTISLFLDANLEYLGFTGKGRNGESAFAMIANQKDVSQIPQDLLNELGSERATKLLRE